MMRLLWQGRQTFAEPSAEDLLAFKYIAKEALVALGASKGLMDACREGGSGLGKRGLEVGVLLLKLPSMLAGLGVEQLGDHSLEHLRVQCRARLGEGGPGLGDGLLDGPLDSQLAGCRSGVVD
jgi:hypothetical protein